MLSWKVLFRYRETWMKGVDLTSVGGVAEVNGGSRIYLKNMKSKTSLKQWSFETLFSCRGQNDQNAYIAVWVLLFLSRVQMLSKISFFFFFFFSRVLHVSIVGILQADKKGSTTEPEGMIWGGMNRALKSSENEGVSSRIWFWYRFFLGRFVQKRGDIDVTKSREGGPERTSSSHEALSHLKPVTGDLANLRITSVMIWREQQVLSSNQEWIQELFWDRAAEKTTSFFSGDFIESLPLQHDY